MLTCTSNSWTQEIRVRCSLLYGCSLSVFFNRMIHYAVQCAYHTNTKPKIFTALARYEWLYRKLLHNLQYIITKAIAEYEVGLQLVKLHISN